MKGFVPTPDHVVDQLVDKLFHDRFPSASSTLLDPGCGTGAFIDGVLRWAQRTSSAIPTIVGIESDVALLAKAQTKFATFDRVQLLNGDFLEYSGSTFDYIVGNPPYVSLGGLSEQERAVYKKGFTSAQGRFDLYSLFFEQSLRLLRPNGRLVFITPEKFLYVQSAERLRAMLSLAGVSELHFYPDDTFEGLTTYPLVTTVDGKGRSSTAVTLRTGERFDIRLSTDGKSWLPQVNRSKHQASEFTLSDAFLRISCGIATGADQVYVVPLAAVPEPLRVFGYPTVSGRDLRSDAVEASQMMLTPYRQDGSLIEEQELGDLGGYLREDENYERLMARTCVTRKPWYAFHENPPLSDILRPKILCKDIAQIPRFIIDKAGEILPRHSVYYLVPIEPERVEELCDYLNSEEVASFLVSNCQRAANGFLRLQSHVLKAVPLPESLLPSSILVPA